MLLSPLYIGELSLMISGRFLSHFLQNIMSGGASFLQEKQRFTIVSSTTLL